MPDHPVPNALVEEVNRKRESYQGFSEATRNLALATKAAASEPAQIIPEKPKLKRTVQISAQGETLSYRLTDDVISINRLGQHRASLSVSISEYMTMVEEIKELLKP